MKLKEKFKKGAQVPISLEFEKAGKITVSFEVLGAAATGPATPKDDGKKK
jgi:copper(I)-binding protein